jgi:predicted CXXCH cytochrome family protein
MRARRVRRYLLATSLLMGGIAPASAVEHPGVIPEDAECTTCHAAKLRGKSVHSAMASSCEVCHLTQTRGDMVLVMLSMPQRKICFACHQESATLQQHKPSAKGLCVDCHDAHSSERKMLLRVDALAAASK